MDDPTDIVTDEALALASKLSGMTGESAAEATVRALRERLDREKAERDDEVGLAMDRLIEQARRNAAISAAPRAMTEAQRRRAVGDVLARVRLHPLPPGCADSSEHGHLYGEDGAPA